MHPLKKSSSKNRLVSTLGLIKYTVLITFLVVLILNDSPISAASICNPSSAVLCAAVDDTADIYINGTYVDSFPYCDIGWACSIKCVNLSAAQMLALNNTGNVIAVYDQNTNCCEVWASWSLDITCADSSRVQVSSDNRPVVAVHDTACVNPNPSPTPQAGQNWYSETYIPDSNWIPPVEMTGKKWGKRLYDPSTGNLLPALSYVVTGPGNGCGAVWFREPFDLTPNPTPPPPIFGITKTASQVHQIYGNQQDTFTLHICNTGGGTQGNTVNILDQWFTSDNWQFQGFLYGGSNVGWSYTDPLFGSISASGGSGPPMTFTFNDGFNANSCYDLAFVLQTWNPTTQCYTWHNDVTLSSAAWPTAQSTVVLDDFCPSATFTRTVTPTFTISPTITPTYTVTSTRTITQTLTISPVYTATVTPTITNTLPATATFTLTITPTVTPPPMVIQLTKTIDKNIVMLGDTITYCLTYNNISGGNATFRIWDTIPDVCDYISSSPAGTVVSVGGHNIIYWDFNNIPNNGSATVCFYVKAARLPFIKFDEFLAWLDDRQSLLAYYAAGG